MTNINQKIQELITENDVVLFMKGNKDFPNCGFSSAVCNILNNKIKVDYLDFNVLEDPELREGIKIFSDWPTIPQLYIKGEFIGGCDIIREMFSNGELEKFLKDKNITINA